jgi:hypothetical protein
MIKFILKFRGFHTYNYTSFYYLSKSLKAGFSFVRNIQSDFHFMNSDVLSMIGANYCLLIYQYYVFVARSRYRRPDPSFDAFQRNQTLLLLIALLLDANYPAALLPLPFDASIEDMSAGLVDVFN